MYREFKKDLLHNLLIDFGFLCVLIVLLIPLLYFLMAWPDKNLGLLIIVGVVNGFFLGLYLYFWVGSVKETINIYITRVKNYDELLRDKLAGDL